MLATYTFWDVIWTMIVFFIWVMFVTWVIMLMIDNFRRTDHSGWAKAGWALFIIFLPIIGAFTYTIVRGHAGGGVCGLLPAVRQLAGRGAHTLEPAAHRRCDQRRGVPEPQGRRNAVPTDMRAPGRRGAHIPAASLVRGARVTGGYAHPRLPASLRPWPAAPPSAGLVRGRRGTADSHVPSATEALTRPARRTSGSFVPSSSTASAP